MGLLDIFRRKPTKAFFAIEGGKGISKEDPIRIRITNWDQAEKVFGATIGKAPGFRDAPAFIAQVMVGSALGEVVKMMFLRTMLGEENVKWTCGPREYYDGHIQSQEIVLKDGRGVLVLWFDFSGCDRPGDR